MKILERRAIEEGIFVYDTNEVGRPGTEFAEQAIREYKAVPGVSFGYTGEAFALPLLNSFFDLHKLYIDHFLKLASASHINPSFCNQEYNNVFVVPDLAKSIKPPTIYPSKGYNAEFIMLFENATSNIYFDLAWQKYLGGVASDLKKRHYWGTEHED